MIRVDETLEIPDDEIVFTVSRGGGPGGQHVNKVATRVTLRFDVEGSPSLDAAQRARLRQRLASRISKDGVLSLSSHETRSQATNRERLVERFAQLLAGALRRRKPRRPTRPSRSSRRRRLDGKRRRGELKKARGKVRRTDD